MDLITALVGLTSLWVSIVYVIVGLLIIPGLRFPLWATLMAGAFFLGCALTHAHIAADVFAAGGHHPESVIPPLDAWLMLVLHTVQGVGGTGFIAAISRRSLVVRLER